MDQQFRKSFDLLEDLVALISAEIKVKYPQCKGEISIKKCPPPFGGRCESAEVVFKF